MNEIVLFWFRRDLRIEDNAGLWHALSSGYKVMPLFIYDRNILDRLEKEDPRMDFLGKTLRNLDHRLKQVSSSLQTFYGTPAEIFKTLVAKYIVKGLYFNRDYEPEAIKRDETVGKFFESSGIPVFSYRDQVIFEKSDVIKDDGTPYTVFTPYRRKWLSLFRKDMIKPYPSENLKQNFTASGQSDLIMPEHLGFRCPGFRVYEPLLDEEHIRHYEKARDFPAQNGTSLTGPHLRFGTVSIREVFRRTIDVSQVFVSELIWREFFMQILFHFPHVTERSFRPEYDRIEWLNDEEHFDRWCRGMTGVPLVDAGMRELAATGYIHNRVRMVVANYLTKILLTDWRWGEAWFAQKLLDYELSSNNGNWQWAAGCGCDAAPYFRIFNPENQVRKFDPERKYIEKWIPHLETPEYPSPVTDYSVARVRALKHYREGISGDLRYR
ncbi:MAG TPA: deoxyribodipyrimidine photo-lyase [Bacteroidales bacterium]|nr:deoxyribodipyrimidine photo-lyase [Bacteroidales bacterium]HRR92437.1 deoxyribodipyrimidine photo-lyase [Bacteroidales bacterium]HRT90164.1 deoxyribodipyrimidine photo-lyase [Bacteroidales bacterium]